MVCVLVREETKPHVVELAVAFWVAFTIIAILVNLLIFEHAKTNSLPLEDNITIRHTDRTSVRSSSDRVQVSIKEDPLTNVTSILTSFEFSFNVSLQSRRFSFGMNSTHVTLGGNYLLNENREAVLVSATDYKSWNLNFTLEKFGAVTLDFNGEYFFNDSRAEELTFRLSLNSTLIFDSSFNRTADFAIFTEFVCNLEEVSYPYALVFNLSLSVTSVGMGGILGVISVLLLMNDRKENIKTVKERS